ncbi:MAG: hypothetical protein KZQ90_09775 [Candidatus Thiodiazotropha sp. (ex Codakia rugifera)]|nr:hypothetical protein [Candidatus Thiodiazotropha sp. (ex Codakia rugifera)]
MNHVKILLITILLFPLASCAQKTMPVKPGNYDSNVFYSIDKEGAVSAVDAKGNMVPLERVEIPFKHNITEIKSIEQITILELQGSHFRLICTSSHRCYYQRLPH